MLNPPQPDGDRYSMFPKRQFCARPKLDPCACKRLEATRFSPGSGSGAVGNPREFEADTAP